MCLYILIVHGAKPKAHGFSPGAPVSCTVRTCTLGLSPVSTLTDALAQNLELVPGRFLLSVKHKQ